MYKESADETEFRSTILSLREELKKVIFGQDPAIDALDRALRISFSGLRTKNKTAGAFLFMGPTGSGKTETGEQLAKKLGVPCKKIDCGEFQHSHEIAKLLGAPPGYMGHNETKGIMTAFYEQVKSMRYGVLILDEIEKADPALYQMCLGLLDKATVTDGNNKELKFENVIVIMTSNVGEKDRKRSKLGFPSGPVAAATGAKTESGALTLEDVGKKTRALAMVDRTVPATKSSSNSQNAGMLRLVFSPEFMGRLDGVVNFADLSPELIPLIADKFIATLKDQAKNNPKGAINLELTQEARTYVAEVGYNAAKGARSILSFMDEAIVGRLADELIEGELEGGGDAVVDVEEDAGTHQRKLAFRFNKAARAATTDGSPRSTTVAVSHEVSPTKAGDVMPDGSIYAGASPDTGKAMYTTTGDASLTMKWDQAMEYASRLDAHGHTDWRVPSSGELNVLYNNRAAIGGFDESGSNRTGWYWSSQVYGHFDAWAQRFSDGKQDGNDENNDSSLRCVR